MKTVIIVEHPEDVQTLSTRKFDPGQTIVISSSPGACWECEKEGIAYQVIDNYYTCSDLLRIGMDNFDDLFAFCSDIDAIFAENFDIIREYELRPARDNIFFIKRLFDALTTRIHILSSIISQEKPDTICTFAPADHQRKEDFSIWNPFPSDASLYRLLLECEGWPCRKQTIQRKGPIREDMGHTHHYQSVFQRIHKRIENLPVIEDIIYQTKNNGIIPGVRIAYSGLLNMISGKPLIQVNFGYNWDCITPDLYSHGYYRYKLRTMRSNEHWKQIDVDPIKSVLQPFCIMNGIDFSHIVFARFAPVLQQSLNFALRKARDIDDFFQRVNPCAVLFSTKSHFFDHMYAHIAHHHGIPVISWQHGEQGIRDTPTTFYTEMMNSDYYLCYGEGVRELFKGRYQHEFPCEKIAVGSSELASLGQASHHHNKKGVMYATTNYYLNDFYISGDKPLSDISLWRSQKKILEALGNTNIEVNFKMHPSQKQTNHLIELIKENQFHNIQIITNEHSFTELLKHVDTVILDWPSTTLMQSIASQKTIFVLLKHVYLTDKARSLLEKRAYVSDDLIEFTDMIARFFRGESLPQKPDINNTEFLKQYCLDGEYQDTVDNAIHILDKACTDRSADQ